MDSFKDYLKNNTLGLKPKIFLVLIILLLFLLLIIQGLIIISLLNLEVIYAEEGYKPRLIDLANRMQRGIDGVVRERINIGARSFSISLTDIGWKFGSPYNTDDIGLFEKFMKTRADLPTYRQVYTNKGRSLAKTWISP